MRNFQTSRPAPVLGLLLTAVLIACQAPSPPPSASKPATTTSATTSAAQKPAISPQPAGVAASPSPTLRQSAGSAPAPVASPAASPSPPPIQTGAVPLDVAALQRIQQDVDQGHMPWRLDPLEVAREEGPKLGFNATDRFELLSQAPNAASGTNHAIVRATHAGRAFEIQLIQPVKIGPNGIWTINDVRPAR